MPFSPGTRLGPFEIVAPLNLPGLGEVYRARDHEHNRDVTMRVLPADFAADPGRLKRFGEEARAATLLSHPNILTVHDIGTDPRTAYVISEPIEGGTLRDALRGGALPVRTVVQYAGQIARGLAAAHQKRVAHHDLKPENILVGAGGHVRIVGFGLATVTQGESALAGLKGSSPGVGLGTPAYMSPEQVKGVPADVRSDMFTFGAIVYEMLTGARAFSGDTSLETMTAVAKLEPKLPAHVELPPVFGRMLELCLRKNQSSRPAAEDVAMALDALAQQPSAPPVTPPPTPAPVRPVAQMPEPLLAPPPTPAPARPVEERPVLTQRDVRAPRRRLVPILLALGALGVLVFAGPAVMRILRTPSQGTTGESASRNPVTTTTTPERPVEDLAPSQTAPPAKTVPPANPSDSRLLWLDRAGKEIGVVGGPADYGDVSLSPDGARVAVSVRPPGSEAADIVLLDIQSGMPTPVTSDSADDTAPVWSPDGRRILFTSARSGSHDIYQRNASAAGDDVAIVSEEGDQIAFDWSSDGRYLLYQTNQREVAAGGNFDLWARPLPSGRPFAYMRTIRAATRPKLSPDRRWVAYTSLEGRDDVYVSRFPRPDGRRRISARGGSWPRWRGAVLRRSRQSPDGGSGQGRIIAGRWRRDRALPTAHKGGPRLSL